MGTLGDDERPETLVAYAERRIKTYIATGVIKPGQRLSPHALSKELDLSHIPVREALTSLSATGFVTYHRGRGFFARNLSSEDLADIYHWRAVLEREAYLLAVPKLTDDDLTQMERLVQQMSSLTSSEDRLEYLELNREFHFVAFRRAGSQRLLYLLTYLWDNAQPYTALELTDSTRGYEEHVALLPIFASRDTYKIIRAMDEHRRFRIDHVTQWEARTNAGYDSSEDS